MMLLVLGVPAVLSLNRDGETIYAAQCRRTGKQSRWAERDAAGQVAGSQEIRIRRDAARVKSIRKKVMINRKPGNVRIGISGWRYAGWRSVFYPEKLPQRRELEFASRVFSTIEINGTFYSLQRPASFAQWAEETPDDFIFALKGSRFITHMKKLRNVEEALANYFAQGVLRLGAKLGPILWQFPPNFSFDFDRFESFFRLLPKTTRDAAAMANKHSPRLHGRTWTEIDHDRTLRHCVEIRHESYVTEEFVRLLRTWDVGLVVADTVEWPLLMDVTSNFVYCRLHGSQELYSSGYESAALDVWAERIGAWSAGGQAATGRFASPKIAKKLPRDVFVYFDNDAKVRAPFDAQKLQERVLTRLSGNRGVRASVDSTE
jgi:uncharacterized protein YecE (DUF72 family)